MPIIALLGGYTNERLGLLDRLQQYHNVIPILSRLLLFFTNSFIRGTILSKGGARIEDLKIFGKSIAKNESKLGKIVSKLPSYQHSTINRDLGMMKENVAAFKSMSKVGKAFKIAGWVGTAVDVTATVTGQTAGRVAGAALGQALIPIPGVGGTIGAVVGGLAGATLGSWLGSLANKELDKGIKPKKKGWSWPW